MKFFNKATRRLPFWSTFIVLLSVCQCRRSDETMAVQSTTIQSLNAISQTRWDELSKKRIFFGHQSVGANILEGIHDIMNQSPLIHLSIKRTRDPKDFEKPLFAEFAIGANENPKSKIDDFRTLMEGGIGAHVDIAFFKLCYIDINANTDAAALFTYYKTAMDLLAAEFPKVRFIHCTAPLTRMDSGVKGFIKKLLGKNNSGLANLRRAIYNKMMTDTYEPGGNLFDIARFESTFPNGTRAVRRINGTDCYGLAPGFTSDGGHLNQSGRVILAKGLLELLQATH